MSRTNRRGLLKLFIMSIVIRKRKIHGYGIYKELDELASGLWNPSIGTIYRILGELERKGYIKRKEEVRGGRRLVYYIPTEKGIEEFLKISDCILKKIRLGIELLVPTFKSLQEKGIFVSNLNDVFENIYYLLHEYLDEKK